MLLEKALHASGIGPAAIAKQLKMARSSVYRVLPRSGRSASHTRPCNRQYFFHTIAASAPITSAGRKAGDTAGEALAYFGFHV